MSYPNIVGHNVRGSAQTMKQVVLVLYYKGYVRFIGLVTKQIKEFEVASNVQLTHRDSITLTAAKKRVPKRLEKANQNLVYFSIDLTCLFGGKGYQKKGSGLRHHKR